MSGNTFPSFRGMTVEDIISKGDQFKSRGIYEDAKVCYVAAKMTLHALDLEHQRAGESRPSCRCYEIVSDMVEETSKAVSTPPTASYGGSQPSQGLAIAALIFAFIIWPVGLILAIIARKNGNTGGLAKAALIISIVFGVLGILSGGCMMCTTCLALAEM